MKVLVIGPGVLGSYLTHAVCDAGHDVTLVARGAWGERIAQGGLVIRHYVQRTTTVDHPRVVPAPPLDERFDIAIAVMQHQQMVALAPDLGRVDVPCVVCVGNDLHVDDVEKSIHEASAKPKTVLFGFQSTAGRREEDHAVCVRAGATGITVGPAHGEVDQASRDLLDQVFCGAYKPHYQHDMHWWLVSHAVAVLPFCYVAYALDCDLTRASTRQIKDLVTACAEGFDCIKAAGGMVLPEGEEGFMRPGPKHAAWVLALRVVAKTAIGRLCVTDHCKNAVPEMRSLDDGIMALFSQVPDVPRPTWDALRQAMPPWDQVERRWSR